MFLARDKDNHLYLFNDLPRKGSECWWAESGLDGTYLRVDDSLYPEITWESDPLPVSLTNGMTDSPAELPGAGDIDCSSDSDLLPEN